MRGSKGDLPVAAELETPAGRAISRQAEWGEMNVALEQLPDGFDTRASFRGLPDDLCQCPHWGYVLAGRVRVVYRDREEILAAGDAYYLAPGHAIVVEAAAELVEFSPREAYRATMEAVARNTGAR